ncbi:MAG: alpha-L-arabinofuranosidase C-terminal domain-containing protein, partial [Kiritimatiellia bacterium]|nr:alpha-L-arabinofuranosidase C-terminal domain-containing protein [Kiritimatiellia bacterium]
MLLTPTYHVFEMYAVHQDATLLPMDIETEQYKFGDESIPAVSGSASLDSAGKVHITLSNTNPKKAVEVSIDVRGSKVAKVSGRVLTAPKMTAHNTFTKADAVKPEKFTGTRRRGNTLSVKMPSKSVVVLELS